MRKKKMHKGILSERRERDVKRYVNHSVFYRGYFGDGLHALCLRKKR